MFNKLKVNQENRRMYSQINLEEQNRKLRNKLIIYGDLVYEKGSI